MRILCTFILMMILSINSFSQGIETYSELGWGEKIKQADKLVKKKDYQNAINICNEILNFELHSNKTWMYYSFTTEATDILFKIYSDKKGSFLNEKKALKYLKINNDHIKLFYKLSDGSLKSTLAIYVPQADKELQDYMLKTGLTLNDIQEENEEEATKLGQNNNNNKSIILTTIGQGINQEQARNFALRSAIEQAFGTYISSNSTILNDQLVKDEIISVNNGNIEKYEIINESKLPNEIYVSTLKVTVSINQLKKYSQSKGVTLEFQGGLFASNILNQENNDKNELIAWRNLKMIIDKLINNSFDYKLKYEEPKKVDTNWYIPIELSISYNKNFEIINKLIFDFIKSISLSKNEILLYNRTNRDVYPIVYAIDENNYGQYFLRNDIVRNEIFMIPQNSFLTSLNNFVIDNGIEKKYFKDYLKYFETHKNSVFIKDHTRESEIFIGAVNGCQPQGFFRAGVGDFKLDPLYSDNFKMNNDSTYYRSFRWRYGSLDDILNYSILDTYENPKQLKNDCIAMQQWTDNNGNFSFLSKLDIESINYNERNSLMKSIPITSFILLKENNYKLFTITMFDIYTLEKINKISKYSVVNKTE